MTGLKLLDILLVSLHVLVIGFNLTGWIWKRTRRWHKLVLLLTIGSWLILGIWYGLGYCFLTDWNWQVKAELGETPLPNSFIKYGLDKLFGSDLPPALVDQVTAIVTALLVVVTLWIHFRDRKKSRG
ncbi:MAG: DUF2784 domain-containing protein [Saprospiraceae bacterium]|nr:DUF2784 domain-containing protein [Saprospiraceae bacterium]